ncbi:MAG: DNA replication/repair protein RecF [Eubacteriales bacterium]|nr:DNA replication/repair protein RecF [Eubacteriales bacterium]
MVIEKIELHNFRNYEDLTLAFDPKVNLITGSNAQGKTNLIEGIFLSSMGRSFRTNKEDSLIRFGQDMARVTVWAKKELVRTKVEIVIRKNSKKYIRKDGTAVPKLSELMRNIIIVAFSPEDLRIVKDEPEKRRKFIDRELAQIKPAYYRCLSDYRKALLQRNVYLKQQNPDPTLLSVWDEQLIREGAKMIAYRKEFIDRIGAYSRKIHEKITNGQEELTLKYLPNVEWAEQEEKISDHLRKALEAHRETDFRMRTTYAGPHKDDMAFYINGIDARKYGSQGQQRTCALSLKLADLDVIREETGEEGILLLDDVMSELDQGRREYLVRALERNQIFITATDVDKEVLNAYPAARVFAVREGTVRERQKNDSKAR